MAIIQLCPLGMVFCKDSVPRKITQVYIGGLCFTLELSIFSCYRTCKRSICERLFCCFCSVRLSVLFKQTVYTFKSSF